MSFEAVNTRILPRIVFATWAVLMPMIPGSFQAAEQAPVVPVADCCRDCCEAETLPGCSHETSVPCSPGNSCPRCPLTAGSAVYLAPDGFGLLRSEQLSLIRPDDQSPCNIYLEPPEHPPQAVVHS